jgi:hypothetical protein
MKKQEAVVGVEAVPKQHIAFFVFQQIRGKEGLSQVNELVIMLGYLRLFAHGWLLHQPQGVVEDILLCVHARGWLAVVWHCETKLAWRAVWR